MQSMEQQTPDFPIIPSVLPLNDTQPVEETSNPAADMKSPTSSESFPKMPSSISSSSTDNKATVSAALLARKRGNLSHLSESDRRSEMSYRSEPSLAISDANRSSKFKVVKLGDKTPYVRGRFTVFDFHDLPVKDAVRVESNVAGTPRVQTPTITGDSGPNGTLTSSVVPVVAGGSGSVAEVPVVAPPAAGEPFHNLHLSSTAPVIQPPPRTAAPAQSPLTLQPQKTPSSRSPVPPNTPTSPNSQFSTVITGVPFPSESVSQSPVPPHSVPVADPLMQDSLSKKNPTPFAEVFPRVSAVVPSGTMTPGRKISGVIPPDPRKLSHNRGEPLSFLQNRGESYFAEMIDRVWESSPGKPTAGGFDRIEAKISQCMSLVTEHVLLAVRADLDDLNKQVAVLKEKAASLECENQVLKMENTLLRNAVNNAMPAAEVTQSRSRMK